MTSELVKVTQAGPLGLLRGMVEKDIEREGATSSTMVRAGLLLDIINELEAARHRISHLPQGEGEVREAEGDGPQFVAAERIASMYRFSSNGDRARGKEMFRIGWSHGAAAALSHPVSSVSREDVLETFCAPGDERNHDVWLLRFADRDCGEQVFGGPLYQPGEAERLAREAWGQFSPSYNCYLFRLAKSSAPSVSEGEVERGRAGTISLEIAAASDEQAMWERRWSALQQLYERQDCFVDRDGKWGLRGFLDYAGQVCGFALRPAPSAAREEGE